MEFDEERPCSSHSRKKNRYTRKELITLFSKQGLPFSNKMTMNDMCEHLRSFSPTVGVSSVSLDENRPCASRSRAMNRYLRNELMVLAEECGLKKELSKKITLDDLCRVLKKSCVTMPSTSSEEGQLMKRSASAKIRNLFLLSKKLRSFIFLKRWIRDVQDIMTKRPEEEFWKKTGKYTSTLYYPIVPEVYCSTVDNILKTNLALSYGTTKVHGHEDIDLDPQKIVWSDSASSSALLLRNSKWKRDASLVKNLSWIKSQVEYLSQLENWQKICLYVYTFRGDRYINLSASDSLDARKFYSEQDKNMYSRDHISPLFGALLAYFHENGKKKTLALFSQVDDMLLDEVSQILSTDFRPYEQSYKFVNKKLFNAEILDKTALQALFNSLSKSIDNIIKKSPPLSESIFLYRATKERDFLKFDFNAILTEDRALPLFKNSRFMSCSISDRVFEDETFINNTTECCAFYIHLLKGSRCLLMLYSYFFKGEREVLLPKNCLLYATSPPFMDPSRNLTSQLITVINH